MDYNQVEEKILVNLKVLVSSNFMTLLKGISLLMSWYLPSFIVSASLVCIFIAGLLTVTTLNSPKPLNVQLDPSKLIKCGSPKTVPGMI